MKIRPEILLSSKNEINYNKILVTGSDESFMLYVKDFIVSDFKKRNFFVDVSGSYDVGVIGGLFSDKRTLFVLADYPHNSSGIDDDKSDRNCVVVVSANSKKTNNIKTILTKRKDALVVECYTLNKSAKEIALKNFVMENNLVLSKDVFWYVVHAFDNNYVLFERQLQMLALFNKRIDL